MSSKDLDNNINSRNQTEKFNEKEELNKMDNASQDVMLKNKTETNYDFGVSAIDLENLMGMYKERGSDFADLNISKLKV